MKNKLLVLITLSIIALAVGSVIAQAPSKPATIKAATASNTVPAETTVQPEAAAPATVEDTEPVAPVAPADPTPAPQPVQPAPTTRTTALPADQAGSYYKPPVNPPNPSMSANQAGVICMSDCQD